MVIFGTRNESGERVDPPLGCCLEILEQRCGDRVQGHQHRAKRTQHRFIRAEFTSTASRLRALKAGSIEVDGLVFLVTRSDEDAVATSDAGSTSGEETSLKQRVIELERVGSEANKRIAVLEKEVVELRATRAPHGTPPGLARAPSPPRRANLGGGRSNSSSRLRDEERGKGLFGEPAVGGPSRSASSRDEPHGQGSIADPGSSGGLFGSTAGPGPAEHAVGDIV